MPLVIPDADAEHVRALARNYLTFTRYAETPPREAGEPAAGTEVIERRAACKRLLAASKETPDA